MIKSDPLSKKQILVSTAFNLLTIKSHDHTCALCAVTVTNSNFKLCKNPIQNLDHKTRKYDYNSIEENVSPLPCKIVLYAFTGTQKCPSLV